MRTMAEEDFPFGRPETVVGWRAAPDCGRCNDTGRYSETRCNHQHKPVTVEAHCTCKKGRRMSEVWQAEKYGELHPDGPFGRDARRAGGGDLTVYRYLPNTPGGEL